MVVCHFFLKGDCRFGDRCKNEHPGSGPKFGGGGYGGNAFGGGGRQPSGGGGNICQHFLKGNCWYGENCKFTHAKPGTSGGGGFGGQGFGQQATSFGQSRPSTFGGSSGGGGGFNKNQNQNRFGALSAFGTPSGPPQTSSFGARQPSQQSEAQPNPGQIQQTVIKDIDAWNGSNQWPLSCYAYYKDEPCFTGLLDFSPEEIRFEAYKANKEGKATVYQQGLKDLVERNKQRRQELKTMPTMQLQSEIRSAKALQSSASMSVSLGSQPATAAATTNLFGASTGSSSLGLSQSLFGGTTASTAGQTSSMFGATSNTGLFGSTPPAQTASPGLFGTTSSSATGMMGGVGMSAASAPGLFGSTTAAPASTNTSLFGAATQPSTGTSLFGSTPQPAAGTGLFGTTQTTQGSGSLFGSSGGTQAAGTSLFGAQTGQTTQGSTSLFGNTSSTQPSAVATPTPAATPSTLKLTCSEQDIAAFKAEKFVLGKIPECPPPPELCS